MMSTEIFKIDASWAEKLTKMRVSFLTAPTVHVEIHEPNEEKIALALLQSIFSFMTLFL